MRLQTLLESAGPVWVIILDFNAGSFEDDDLFENMELFSSEAKCVDRIFEHYDKAFFDAGAEDLCDELKKLRKRTQTVKQALELMGEHEDLDHLSDILLVKQMIIK